MPEYFNDPEVNELLTRLLDRLCFLERETGEAYNSTLIFFAGNVKYPMLLAREGKSFFPQEHLSSLDVEMAVKVALKERLPKYSVGAKL